MAKTQKILRFFKFFDKFLFFDVIFFVQTRNLGKLKFQTSIYFYPQFNVKLLIFRKLLQFSRYLWIQRCHCCHLTSYYMYALTGHMHWIGNSSWAYVALIYSFITDWATCILCTHRSYAPTTSVPGHRLRWFKLFICRRNPD